MDGNELQEWEAYAELEPWGEERQDLRFAMLTAFLYNSMRGKSQPQMSAAEFMPNFLDDPAERETDTGEGAFLAMTQMSGGAILDAGTSDAEVEAYILANSGYEDTGDYAGDSDTAEE